MQTRSSDENSVCLSVCRSVKLVHCDKTEERSVQNFIPHQRPYFSLVSWEEEWLVGDWGRPLLLEILGVSINQSISLYRAIVQRRVLQCCYAESKRNVLRRILNVLADGAVRQFSGREFQSLGAATEKRRAAVSKLCGGTDRSLWSQQMRLTVWADQISWKEVTR